MCPPSNLTAPSTSSPSPAAVPAIVPPDALSQSAYQHAHAHLHPAILAHSLRVFSYAQTLAQHERSAYGSPSAREEHALLFAACVFHDIGTSAAHNTGPARFEVEGADAAVSFLARSDSAQHVTADQRHAVWVAIALHTSAQIAERIGPLARLLRTAVLIDFKGERELRAFAELLGGGGGGGKEEEEEAQRISASAGVIAEIEKRFPRGQIEKVLGDAVVGQALLCADKAPAASWPGVMLRSKRESMEWDGVNKAF